MREREWRNALISLSCFRIEQANRCFFPQVFFLHFYAVCWVIAPSECFCFLADQESREVLSFTLCSIFTVLCYPRFSVFDCFSKAWPPLSLKIVPLEAN